METTRKKNLHWVNVLFFTGTGIAALTLTPLYLYYSGITWGLVALFFLYAAVTAMSITAGYHRFFSHRSFDAKFPVKLAFLLFGAGAFQGSALQWCTDHRRHHRHVDTEKDPHNIKQGFLWAHIGWLFFEDEISMSGEYPDDLTSDRLVMWQHRHYVPLAIFMCFGVPTLIGALMGTPLGGLLVGGLLRVVATSHSTFLINSYAHTFGRRTYDNLQTARDSFLLALFAFGEGYHNYHHRFASDYRNGIRWYQWDPTKWLIRSLSWVGLTSRLKRIPQTEILRARLKNEEQSLLLSGLSAERIQMLRQRIEQAQVRCRELREEFHRMKADLESRSRERLRLMKADLKVARLEVKFAMAQWAAYVRVRRGMIPAYNSRRF